MDSGGVRVVTFNTAVGNPKITTPQRDFLQLPIYREIIDGKDGAAILALQEVGAEQAAALKRAAGARTFRMLHISRPGQGNALLVPARYRVIEQRSCYFCLAHLRARGRVELRQRFELRMWTRARLHDELSGRELTVFNTHLSGDANLRLQQARSLLRRVHRASGPVILAGDLNTRPASGGVDADIRARFAPLRDMAPDAVDPRRPAIDWILATGFEPVSARLYTGDALSLPAIGNAEQLSDHYAKEALLSYA